VRIQLPTGEKQTLGPVTVRPAARAAFPGMELPYARDRAATALSLKPTGQKGFLFLLFEGPATPGPALMLDAIPVGFPTDVSVSRFEVGGQPNPASLPCVSRTAFFIDRVGKTPPDTVLVWFREGERETSFRVNRQQRTLRLRPILSFDTEKLALLARKASEYSVVSEATVGRRDYLVIVVVRKPDHSFITAVFSAARGGFPWGNFVQGISDNWNWCFYAVDDGPALHNHCRGR
jgi:hypothetical protein